jgi:hypothetical protein
MNRRSHPKSRMPIRCVAMDKRVWGCTSHSASSSWDAGDARHRVRLHHLSSGTRAVYMLCYVFVLLL